MFCTICFAVGRGAELTFSVGIEEVSRAKTKAAGNSAFNIEFLLLLKRFVDGGHDASISASWEKVTFKLIWVGFR